LKTLKLETVPDFTFTWIDGYVNLVRPETQDTEVESSPTISGDVNPTSSLPEVELVKAVLIGGAIADPTHRIGKLDAANQGVVAVHPEDTLTKAITLMLTKNFSQLPVMPNERDAKGMVTWASIGARLASGQTCPKVKDCSDKYYDVSSDESIFSVIPTIVANQYVLVRDPKDRKITGIVTPADLSFQQLAEPFLLLGEIEHLIRRLIENKFTQAELSTARDPNDQDRGIDSVADLTLGECIRLLENQDSWTKLMLPIDRVEFIKEAHRVRNDVMHFDPDPMPQADLGVLRSFASFLEKLWEKGIAHNPQQHPSSDAETSDSGGPNA
jgi:predicted transcriptional regulator